MELLVDALAARGLAYYVAVQSVNFDFELPSSRGFDVRHTVRDVILARANASTSGLKLLNPQRDHFANNCVIAATIGPIPILRGWVSIDGKLRGQRFRVVSTHLDGDCVSDLSIQQAQAQEILNGPGATNLPLILAADLNSPADGSGVTYSNLVAAGFSDAWSVGGGTAGFSPSGLWPSDHAGFAVTIRGHARHSRGVIARKGPLLTA